MLRTRVLRVHSGLGFWAGTSTTETNDFTVCLMSLARGASAFSSRRTMPRPIGRMELLNRSISICTSRIRGRLMKRRSPSAPDCSGRPPTSMLTKGTRSTPTQPGIRSALVGGIRLTSSLHRSSPSSSDFQKPSKEPASPVAFTSGLNVRSPHQSAAGGFPVRQLGGRLRGSAHRRDRIAVIACRALGCGLDDCRTATKTSVSPFSTDKVPACSGRVRRRGVRYQ